MPQTYSDETRARCKSLYCYRGLEIPEIAEMTPPSESTLRRWRAESGWDEQRMARSVSGRMIAEQLKQQVWQTVKAANEEGRLLDNGEVDRVRKLRKDIKELDDTELYVGHAMDAFDEFSDWLAEHYPERRKRMVSPIMEFLREVIQEEA